MEVKDAELVTLTDFRRKMTNVVAGLAKGDLEKAVVMKNGRAQFVVLSVDEYKRLRAKK